MALILAALPAWQTLHAFVVVVLLTARRPAVCHFLPPKGFERS